jgi:hypothetical protein
VGIDEFTKNLHRKIGSWFFFIGVDFVKQINLLWNEVYFDV